jgi:transcription elongation GreA/GreB family factor
VSKNKKPSLTRALADGVPPRRSRVEKRAMEARAEMLTYEAPLTRACERIAEQEEQIRFLKNKLANLLDRTLPTRRIMQS